MRNFYGLTLKKKNNYILELFDNIVIMVVYLKKKLV